jgi:hypothetical protein
MKTFKICNGKTISVKEEHLVNDFSMMDDEAVIYSYHLNNMCKCELCQFEAKERLKELEKRKERNNG